MYRNRHLAMRLRHVMRIDGGDPADGSGADPKGEPKSEPKGGNEPDGGEAAAKRLAELEAKLADWEQVKAKADKWDAHEASAGDKDKDGDEALAKLNERLAAIEQERDELKAKQARRDLVDKVAEATGLDANAVAMLNGDDEKALADAATSLLALMDGKAKSTKPRGPKPPRTDPVGADASMSPMDRMRAAYSN